MTVPEFIAKWRKVELKERSAAQEHFLDLCRVFDHPTPAAADPTGETYCFEKGAAKAGGAGVPPAQGFADVWKRGFWGWEYKGKHKDLADAYDQLLRYRDALESPPLLLCCDLGRIVVHTNFTGTVSATHEIPLEALGEPRNLEILRAVFHHPEALRPGRTSATVTQDAAKHFAEIAASMRQRGLDPAAVAHFLDRLVFCLFAEDAHLLPDMVFSRMVKQAAGDPVRFCKILGQLFDAMATGGDLGFEPIRHFNGNLFDDRTVLPLAADEVQRVAAAAGLDWSAVDPSIFGTLFERGLDPAKRAQLGAHFTGREDIELVVDAVVMVPLRREWAETKALLECLLATGKKKPGSAGVPPAPVSVSKNATTMAAPPSVAGGTPALPGVSPPAKPPREWHSRGYLPHFDHPGLVQTIAFRLADSLPAELAARLAERGRQTDDPELRKEIEAALDLSHGACHLRNSNIARTVQDALLHFDGQRYRLLAWVVMPNHVHVMIETLPGVRLEEVVHTWKSFTAKECNRLLNRSGAFWQEDYYDRFIRDGEHLRKAREYIEQNPVKAGLATKPEDWPFGNAGSAGVPPAPVSAPGNAAKMALPTLAAGGTPALPGFSPPRLSSSALAKARGEAGSILHRFLDRLQAVKILDPACGSGNFLYVSLLRLKDLEKEAILFGGDNGLGTFLPTCGPWQLHGIEVNPYAHDLAQMTVWIGWLQWIRANGFGSPADPILRPLSGNIRLMDAILSGGAGVPPASPESDTTTPPASLSTEAGETPAPPAVSEPDWPAVDFIVGNPPFLGGKMLRRELGDTYVDRMLALWKDRVPAEADLCCYWFEKARAHIAAGKCQRAGLLATQGIRGGANREVLKRIKETGDIFWAESDRPWVLDGANVHVSMVAFGPKGETFPGSAGVPPASTHDDAGKMPAPPDFILDGTSVPTINANLTGAADLTQARRIAANAGISFMGDTKVGPFDVPETLVREWLPLRNPNAKPSSDVLRPWANGLDVTRQPQRLWIVDFPPGMTETEAAQYEAPFEYALQHVKPMRAANKRPVYAQRWWIHAEARPDMRAALSGLPRYLATPSVSKHRVFVWLDASVLPDHQLIVFARSDDFFFGILHSRIHEVWALAQGTQLETRPRYTPTTCFETFPFPGGAGVPPASTHDDAGKMPAPPEISPIAAAARELDAARCNWLGDRSDPKRTLTALYNARPAWLAHCHAKLDAAVVAAYGWPADLPDDAILERLLALNHAATTCCT